MKIYSEGEFVGIFFGNVSWPFVTEFGSTAELNAIGNSPTVTEFCFMIDMLQITVKFNWHQHGATLLVFVQNLLSD